MGAEGHYTFLVRHTPSNILLYIQQYYREWYNFVAGVLRAACLAKEVRRTIN